MLANEIRSFRTLWGTENILSGYLWCTPPMEKRVGLCNEPEGINIVLLSSNVLSTELIPVCQMTLRSGSCPGTLENVLSNIFVDVLGDSVTCSQETEECIHFFSARTNKTLNHCIQQTTIGRGVMKSVACDGFIICMHVSQHSSDCWASIGMVSSGSFIKEHFTLCHLAASPVVRVASLKFLQGKA